MNRFTSKQQAEFLKARNRQIKLVKLLDSFEWESNGYADKRAWLRDKYGHGQYPDLLLKCQEQFEKEGLL
jgi:hypothetical protein